MLRLPQAERSRVGLVADGEIAPVTAVEIEAVTGVARTRISRARWRDDNNERGESDEKSTEEH